MGMQQFMDDYLERCAKNWSLFFKSDFLDISTQSFINKVSELLYQNLRQLPVIENSLFSIEKDAVQIIPAGLEQDLEKKSLEDVLKKFGPWRKGPFLIGDIFIQSEWRCYMKWNRIQHEFLNKKVLDVGCGNGYFLWRMIQKQAKVVVGCDPYLLYFFQYLALQRFCSCDTILFLPCGYQAFEGYSQHFDTVLSMGVLYHQKNVFEHLSILKSLLVPNGTLILETLILESDEQIALCPVRYANMKNVFFIPSKKTLFYWLEKSGFVDIQVQDCSYTTVDEQASTEWSNDVSLVDALDSKDISKTIEGYQAPLRLLLTAKKKGN